MISVELILILQSGPEMTFEQAQRICHEKVVVEMGFACVQLVYGRAGMCMCN